MQYTDLLLVERLARHGFNMNMSMHGLHIKGPNLQIPESLRASGDDGRWLITRGNPSEVMVHRTYWNVETRCLPLMSVIERDGIEMESVPFVTPGTPEKHNWVREKEIASCTSLDVYLLFPIGLEAFLLIEQMIAMNPKGEMVWGETELARGRRMQTLCQENWTIETRASVYPNFSWKSPPMTGLSAMKLRRELVDAECTEVEETFLPRVETRVGYYVYPEETNDYSTERWVAKQGYWKVGGLGTLFPAMKVIVQDEEPAPEGMVLLWEYPMEVVVFRVCV